ncbi:MAG: phage integrase SAM-like domain-containing protein [Bacteroidales bacterium]
MLKDAHVTSEKVKNEFLGISTNNETLISLFDRHNEDVKKLVGISKSKATYQKYTVTRKHVANFIKSKYKLSDISLKEINLMFLEDFAVYLQTECNCNSNTTAKFMQFLKRIVLIARNNGIISNDPFANYKIRIKKVDRGRTEKDATKEVPHKTLGDSARYFHLLLLHGTIIHRREEPHNRQHQNKLRRQTMDYDQTPKDECSVEHPAFGYSIKDYRQIQRSAKPLPVTRIK